MIKSFFFIFLISTSLAAKDKEVVFGISHFPPYVDKDKEDLGIFPTFFKGFFKGIDRPVKFKIIPYSRTLELIKGQKIIDVAIAGSANIPEIEKKTKVLKSDPFYHVRFCAFYDQSRIDKKVTLKEFSGLKKYRVVSFIKSPINEFLKKENIRFDLVSKIDEAMKMIAVNRADYFVTSEKIGHFYVKQDPSLKNITCKDNLYIADIHLITSKTSEFSKLISKLNKYLIKHKLN